MNAGKRIDELYGEITEAINVFYRIVRNVISFRNTPKPRSRCSGRDNLNVKIRKRINDLNIIIREASDNFDFSVTPCRFRFSIGIGPDKTAERKH